jgi:hypothetical protein
MKNAANPDIYGRNSKIRAVRFEETRTFFDQNRADFFEKAKNKIDSTARVPWV